MDFSSYNLSELFGIYWQLGLEFLKRLWWACLALTVITVLLQIFMGRTKVRKHKNIFHKE
jgi:hypothetical protein